MKATKNQLLFISGLISVAVISRFLPHPPNVTPLTAIALLGGAYLSNQRLALLIPFAAMLLSDLVIGFHSTMWAVYLSFGLIVYLGSFLKQANPLSIAGTSLISSVLFFIVTNFAVWLGGDMYTQDFSGMVTCYVSAIPFFQNSILGDFFFTGVLFGLTQFAFNRITVLKSA